MDRRLDGIEEARICLVGIIELRKYVEILLQCTAQVPTYTWVAWKDSLQGRTAEKYLSLNQAEGRAKKAIIPSGNVITTLYTPPSQGVCGEKL
jgi:hypothetical protein